MRKERWGDTAALEEVARRVRRHIIEMTAAAGSGHASTSLSVTEILVSLYFEQMNAAPDRLTDPDRDRLVLSKGHGAPGLYAVMAERGYFPVEELRSLRRFGSRLQGHPDPEKLPGIEIPTGSLGQGFSVAVGMALAARIDGRSYRVYAVLGDGECQEGQIWEAALAAAHHRLDRLVAIVDRNGLQQTAPTEALAALDPLPDKWRAFGWHAVEVDGHSFQALREAFAEAAATTGAPTAIVARTVKGKGVPFMENVVGWHGKAPNEEERRRALAVLGDEIDER